MRILFVNQYYWPDHASTAQHLTDLAEFLAAKGFECHVLASQGRYKPGEPRPPAFEIHEGVHIHRVPATSLGRRGTWARMTDYLSFYSGAAVKALRLPRFDIVVTLTTPPIIGLIGTILKHLRGCRHIMWSMDLHPDASMALGRMSPRSAFRPLDVCPEPRGLPPRRSGRRARPLHGRPHRAQAGRRRENRHDPGLEPPRRDLPAAARREPTPQVARPRGIVRRHVLGQPGACSFLRRVSRRSPPAARALGYRLPLRR